LSRLEFKKWKHYWFIINKLFTVIQLVLLHDRTCKCSTSLPCQTSNRNCTISSDLWPPHKQPRFNQVDCKVWGIIQQRAYQPHVHVFDQLEYDENLIIFTMQLRQFLKFCFHKCSYICCPYGENCYISFVTYFTLLVIVNYFAYQLSFDSAIAKSSSLIFFSRHGVHV